MSKRLPILRGDGWARATTPSGLSFGFNSFSPIKRKK
jgi:hypothetical protein